MPTVGSDAARQLRDPIKSRGRQFVFAFQANDQHRATHVLVASLNHGWVAGDGETRWNLSVTGPPQDPYRHLAIMRDDQVAVMSANGHLQPGFFAFLEGEHPHVLWRRFAAYLPERIWDRLPVNNPLITLGRPACFSSNVGTTELNIHGRVLGLRSMAEDPHGCCLTVDGVNRQANVDLMLDSDNRWKTFVRGCAGSVCGTVTFG